MNLSKLKDIRVVPKTASMQYKGVKPAIKTIGRDLGIRYYIEGSVRKFKDNLRITAQLIDVETEAQLWAETYKGNLADIFDIQEKVSKQIVEALKVKLTPQEEVVLTKRATANHEAFDSNLRARDFLYQYNKNKLKIAIQLFEKTIQLDPEYANAYAGLGEAYANLYQLFERNEQWLEKSIEASSKALMYDSTLSEAYAALGLCYFNKEMINEALRASKKAIELDPSDFIGYWNLGRIYHSTDRDEEAIELYNKVIELNPEFYSAYTDLRMSYTRLSHLDKAKEIINLELKIFPQYLFKHPDDARAHLFFANTLTLAGRNSEAKSEAATAMELNPSDPLMMYNLACFYSLLNEKELAIESLQKSINAGHEDYEWFKRDPDLDNIRNEPKYIELLKGR
jgi:adenylate cyclase